MIILLAVNALAWGPCSIDAPGGAECEGYEVLLDRERPDRGTVDLAVKRVMASVQPARGAL